MSRRFNRRITRPLEDLPSLFGDEGQPAAASEAFTVSLRSEKALAAAPQGDDDSLRLDDRYRTRAPRLRFMSMGSGSSGNCTYVGTPDDGILIDAGIDNNKVTQALERNGIDISTIRGIFLTHDHADHVKFAYALLRRNPHMRLFATLKTLEGVLRRHSISRRIKDYHSPIFKEHEYTLGNLVVTPFETSHDGTDNCGFFLRAGDSTLVIATDMGIVTDRADYYLRRADSLMIESNYDSDMLTRGRYAEHLKARIRSAIGHMDNSVTARYLADIYRPELNHIFLCHLSDDNNTPETAVATVLNALRTVGVRPATSTLGIGPAEVFLIALPRYDVTELYLL